VFTKVSPGETYRERVLLNKSTGDEWFEGRLLIEQYALTQPGTYRVKVARAVGGERSSGWLYANMEVNVTRTTGN